MSYFISYNYPGGHGNLVFSCDGKITGIDDIRGIQKLIADKFGADDAIVINFIELATD